MRDVDPETFLEAARSLGRIRSLSYRCFFGLIALIVLVGAPTYAFEFQLDPFDRRVLVSILGIGLLPCLAGIIIAWSRLIAFWCPRCGENFAWPSWPSSDRCIACGLDLGPSAITAGKPPADADL